MHSNPIESISDIRYNKGRRISYGIERFIDQKGLYHLPIEQGDWYSKVDIVRYLLRKKQPAQLPLRVVMKLCKKLEISVDDIVKLDPIPYNPAYEENLPSFLE